MRVKVAVLLGILLWTLGPEPLAQAPAPPGGRDPRIDTPGDRGPRVDDAALVARARGIHERVIALDTHNDINPADFTAERNYTQRLDSQVNLPKMRDGGLDASFFIVYVGQGELTPEGYDKAYKAAIDKFDAIHRLTEQIAPDQIELALTASDVRRIAAKGKKVALIGVENGYPIGEDLRRVEAFFTRGARYLSLAHNGHSQLADSNTGERDGTWLHNGLSPLGRQVIAELNRLGILVDVSHPSKAAMMQAVALSRAPIIASHSAVRALCNHSRNMDDEQLLALKQNGGVIQVVALSSYVKERKPDSPERAAAIAALRKEFGLPEAGAGPGRGGPGGVPASGGGRGGLAQLTEARRADFRQRMAEIDRQFPGDPPATVKQFVDHLDYAVKLIGIDHVGISSDFDGGGGITGWNDASETFNVTLELVRRGYTEAQIAKLWSGNLLRVMEKAEAVARELQKATTTTGNGGAAGQHEHGGTGEALGTVRFDTSCASAGRDGFNRAVALLHSFEFRSAIDAFTAVLQTDPSCAMAHWGITLSVWGNPFGGLRSANTIERGRTAAMRAQATGTPTPRERAYIDAVAELYRDADRISQRDRTLAYERAMEALTRAYPNDTEAKIFYGLSVNQTALATDKTYANQLKAAAIYESLWQAQPNHPGLAHYIIHAYDHPPLAPRALEAARRYAKIAPSAPHALHMPSHTFTRVGYWQDSIATNIASAKAATKLGTYGEALHAMDYQVYAYLQMAQDAAARRVLDRLPEALSRFNPDAIGGAAPGSAGLFAAAAIPARYALERGAWADAAALEPRATTFAWVDAVTHFARALGAARSGRPDAARPDVERLAALREKLVSINDTYWAGQVDIQRRVAEAWIAFAAGRRDEGIALLGEAADAEDATDKSAISPGPLAPARELHGEMLLEAGRAQEALAAFEATMKKEPKRFRGAYGAARAAEALGDRALAVRYYRETLDIARGADTQRPEIGRARAFVRKS
jgi:microsomal dipeptidase-like Zn-dependent dipeptidase